MKSIILLMGFFVSIACASLCEAAEQVADINESEVTFFREFLARIGIKDDIPLKNFAEVRRSVVSALNKRNYDTVIQELRSQKDQEGKLYFEEGSEPTKYIGFQREFYRDKKSVALFIYFSIGSDGKITSCNLGRGYGDSR